MIEPSEKENKNEFIEYFLERLKRDKKGLVDNPSVTESTNTTIVYSFRTIEGEARNASNRIITIWLEEIDKVLDDFNINPDISFSESHYKVTLSIKLPPPRFIEHKL